MLSGPQGTHPVLSVSTCSFWNRARAGTAEPAPRETGDPAPSLQHPARDLPHRPGGWGGRISVTDLCCKQKKAALDGLSRGID